LSQDPFELTWEKLAMSLKIRWLSTIVAACLVVTAAPAFADTVTSLMVAGNNTSSDESREYLIDNVRNVDNAGNPIVGTTTGQLDVGDSLRTFFNMNTLNSAGGNLGGATPNNQWSGLAQIMVISKTPSGIPGFFNYTFGPDPAFAADIGGGVYATGIAGGLGAMVMFFESVPHTAAFDYGDPGAPVSHLTAFGGGALGHDDGAPHGAGPHTGPGSGPIKSADVSVGPYGDEEAFGATVIGPVAGGLGAGVRFWTLGFTTTTGTGPGSAVAGPGQGWFALGAPGSVLPLFDLPFGSTAGSFNFAINRIANGFLETGDGIALGTLSAPLFGFTADFIGSGNIRGVNNLDTPFEAGDNVQFDFFVNAFVPEPSSMALLGIGGVSLLAGYMRRRRARVQA
jgi:hypothetical protein